MSHAAPAIGTIGWLDMAVDDAATVRDFYAAVAGWTPHPVAMANGAYDDYAMAPPEKAPVAGVCWRRGPNADFPKGWIPYFVVADLGAAVDAALAHGGKIARDGRGPNGAGYVALLDPAGVGFALWQTDPGAADPTADA